MGAMSLRAWTARKTQPEEEEEEEERAADESQRETVVGEAETGGDWIGKGENDGGMEKN